MTQPTPDDVENALSRVRDVSATLEWLRAQERRLADARDDAIVLLAEAGWSYEAIARESGLTRGRIGQIVLGQRD